VSLIDQMAHQEKKILDNVGKSVEHVYPDAPPNRDSSFESYGHTVNVTTQGQEGPQNLQQQFQNQAKHLLNEQREANDSLKDQSGGMSKATLQGSFQNQESGMLNSRSTVLTVARADQERQAALEKQRLELARLLRQEAIEEAKMKAEQRKADEQRSR